MPFHTIRTARPPRFGADGRPGRLVPQPSTERLREGEPFPSASERSEPEPPYVDAFHVRGLARAASLTPHRSAVPTAFKPPPRDLTADDATSRATVDLDSALMNLRNLPDPIGPFQPDANPWPALQQHRNLLIQQARIARRTLQGYRVGQSEADLSPAALARLDRIQKAEAEAKTHSGRSPQHGRI